MWPRGNWSWGLMWSQAFREGGLFRVNVPLETAVAPIGEVPVAEERRFSLTPGHLDEEAMAQAIRASITSADGLEYVLVREHAVRLGSAAQRGDGCAAWDEIRADWDVIFAGYELSIDAVQDGCAVNIETSRRQHGRRFKEGPAMSAVRFEGLRKQFGDVEVLKRID